MKRFTLMSHSFPCSPKDVLSGVKKAQTESLAGFSHELLHWFSFVFLSDVTAIVV